MTHWPKPTENWKAMEKRWRPCKSVRAHNMWGRVNQRGQSERQIEDIYTVRVISFSF